MAKDSALQTISINLPRELVERIQNLAFYQNFSTSSIVEQSLLGFIDHHSDSALGERLRVLGAKLRRA